MKIDVYMKPRLTGIGAARNRLQNTNPYTDALIHALPVDSGAQGFPPCHTASARRGLRPCCPPLKPAAETRTREAPDS